MTEYKLTQEDKKVIEFTESNLLPIANEVTNFYSHWTKSDEEDHLQKAFLYECRQREIVLSREVAITQYYKDLAFTEKELDFFVFPEQNKLQLPTGIFIETKADYQDDTGQTRLDGRYQLFRYLYSSSHNPDQKLRNANYGIFLIWGQNYDHKQFQNLKTFSIIENKVEAYIELWRAVDNSKTKFSKIYQSKSVDILIESLSKDNLIKLCIENDIEHKASETKPDLIKKLKENGISIL
jgi:hypothetical protein